MQMPPMLGRGHHFFLLKVEVEVEEGVPGMRVTGVLRLGRGVTGGEDQERGKEEWEKEGEDGMGIGKDVPLDACECALPCPCLLAAPPPPFPLCPRLLEVADE
jgi:hypothetical protein